jgi:hypothetical protein
MISTVRASALKDDLLELVGEPVVDRLHELQVPE